MVLLVAVESAKVSLHYRISNKLNCAILGEVIHNL
jgi:hypothetical protein